MRLASREELLERIVKLQAEVERLRSVQDEALSDMKSTIEKINKWPHVDWTTSGVEDMLLELVDLLEQAERLGEEGSCC